MRANQDTTSGALYRVADYLLPVSLAALVGVLACAPIIF